MSMHNMDGYSGDALDLDKLIGRQLLLSLLFVVLTIDGVVPKGIVFLPSLCSLVSLSLSLFLLLPFS